MTVRPEKRRDPDKRVREVRVRQEVAGDRGGFVGECELASQVVGAADREGRAIRESKWNDGERRRGEEGG